VRLKDKKRTILSNVSFITTIFNEEENIEAFLKSLMEQTCLPHEIIMVEGGSKDKTFDIAQDFFKKRALRKNNGFKTILNGRRSKIKESKNNTPAISVRLIKDTGANISQGRNNAIKNTTGEIICVSDAGCILDKNWLKEITAFHSDNSCIVIGGLNLPFCRNFLQKCLAACIMPSEKEIKAKEYMPSSRNISFKKKIWADAGGYPEDMDYGEDMKFNFNVRTAGYRIRFNPGAVVYWKMRENNLQVFRQFFRYAKGDASGRMYPKRHIIRFTSFAVFIIILLGIFYLSKWILVILIPLFGAYVFKPYRRLIKNSNFMGSCRLTGAGIFLSILFIPLLLLQIDFSKMCGYLYGLLRNIIQ